MAWRLRAVIIADHRRPIVIGASSLEVVSSKPLTAFAAWWCARKFRDGGRDRLSNVIHGHFRSIVAICSHWVSVHDFSRGLEHGDGRCDLGDRRSGTKWSSVSELAKLGRQSKTDLNLAVTYHVVVPFDRDEEGDLKPGPARAVMSPVIAERRARALVLEHVGAVAFSRTGNPVTGEFEDAAILVQFGEVDLDALSDWSPLRHQFANE
jgi:hypothetical protein